MRLTPLMAGLVVALAACGGERKPEDQQQAPATPEQQQPAETPAPAGEAPAGGGATHDVNMVLEGSSYKYVPDKLTIKSGDVVRFHNVSGFPHNVSFWADSIPAGAAKVLQQPANMPDQMSPLQGPLLTEPNAVYEVKFTGAPKGDYKFYCLPHIAFKMVGQLKVE